MEPVIVRAEKNQNTLAVRLKHTWVDGEDIKAVGGGFKKIPFRPEVLVSVPLTGDGVGWEFPAFAAAVEAVKNFTGSW